MSASDQKPCPWLPFGTKSLAWAIAKLSVGVSEKPTLSVDVLLHTSPREAASQMSPRTGLHQRGTTAQFSDFFAQMDFIMSFVGLS